MKTARRENLRTRRRARGLGAGLALALFGAVAGRAAAPEPASVPLRAEYAHTLTTLIETLERLQLGPERGDDAGALACPRCDVLHTRAAEAVWPLAQQFLETGDERHLQAARALGMWLFRQQQPDGSWKETPEEWTGTTTDQLLMLVLAYESLATRFEPAERAAWLGAIEHAADYLARTMSPQFASINYCATTAASLAAAHRVVPKPAYGERAHALARATVALLDEDGFLNGEGGKSYGRKMGIDLGYSLEMSLWGLAYYAKLTNDTLVHDLVRASLRSHLPFIYPDGMMDNTWGIRSNKWTVYGSATSDGCQTLFALFADDDPAYASAAWRNLQFLRTCIRDGLVDYGPHHGTVMREPPCIYPTFTKAKNLAMAMAFDPQPERALVPLPSDRLEWQRQFPTIDVVLTRTHAFMGTVTAYRYKDIAAGPKGKYMFRPSGGALSCLWLEGHGLVQASSQTEYHRWEPMSFPVVDGKLRPLTPRIEFTAGENYFTNLFEFDGRLRTETPRPGEFVVSTYGELRDRSWHHGGVSYRLTHTFRDNGIVKEITLFYRGATPEIRIVEPIVWPEGTRFTQTDARSVEMQGAKRRIQFYVTDGNVKLESGREVGKYWSPYPALRAWPIELVVPPPAAGELQQTVRFAIRVDE